MEQLQRYKASDIVDEIFLAAVNEAAGIGKYEHPIAMRWDVERLLRYEYPAVPDRVVMAKFKRLLKRGLVDGCDCWCRGDWEVLG